MNRELLKPGLSNASKPETDVASPIDLKLGKVTRLIDMLSDMVFYTPALLHLTVPLTYDPFAQFCAEYGQDVQRYTLRFDKPMFTGLTHPSGDTSWNYVLFAIDKPHWEAYSQWLGTCVFKDSGLNRIMRVRLQEGVIADPLAKQGGLSSELLPITCVVIETNIGTFYFQPEPLSCRLQARFDSTAVHQDVLDFAANLDKGSNDPYGAKLLPGDN